MVAPKFKMKAILHKEFGGPEVLVVTNDVEIPQIEKNEVSVSYTHLTLPTTMWV